MLRCGEGATTEVLPVLFEPLPPRTHPKVTFSAGATTTELTGSVVTPGALVLLPEKASALVERAWRSIPELAVAISEDRRSSWRDTIGRHWRRDADTTVELSKVKWLIRQECI